VLKQGALVVWLSLLASSAQAQGTLTQIGFPGENTSTARRLAAVDQLVADAKWAEAIAEYLHILEEAGDDLVPLDPRRSVAARKLCHRRLAALPPPALQQYRDRVDGQVKKWWDEGKANHDTRLLRRIVQEAFCSRFGDRALDSLGDLAFERGDFEDAEQWWRLLAPPIAGDTGPIARVGDDPGAALVFPDSQVDVARVRAKQILSRMCRGEREAADKLIQAYRTRHANAAGDFAGQRGNYADILQTLAPVNPVTTPPWPTFAGAASRECLLPQAPASYLVPLPPISLDTGNRGNLLRAEEIHVLTPSAEAQEMAFYPVVAGGQVLVADAGGVRAFDLTTGQRTGSYNLIADLKSQGMEFDLDFATPPGGRYTLTVAGGKIFARLGNACVGALRVREGAVGDSCLVCLDQKPTKEGKFIRRWLARAQEGKDNAGSVFEGAPVVHEGRVYVARARVAGAQVATAIECYSAATGFRHWRQEVSEIRELSDGEPRWHQQLVTLAGSQVVYCTHSGAVVAVDTATGRRTWAVRYLSRGLKSAPGAPSPRDLAPCVSHAGRLFVAPADYDRILCLDAATGKTLWESQAVEAVHLLGVARGKLIVTTGRSSPGVTEAPEPRGIRALDVETGRMLRDWMQPADGTGDLPSLGRGLLAGGKVLWPVQRGARDRPRGLVLLDLETGEADRDNYYFSQRFRGVVGNLALGEGCLAAASARELRVFVPAARQLGQLRKEAAAHPDSAAAQFGLALAEADAGRPEQALGHFAQAGKLARLTDVWEGRPLAEAARRQRHELLLALAERRERARQWDKAVAWLEQAAASEFPADQLAAMVRLGELWTAAREPTRALHVWQSILADPMLRRLETDGPTGLPVNAAALAFDRIESLKRSDAKVYEPLERRARTLAAAVQGDRWEEAAARLAREFPNAAVTGPALLQLAEWRDRAEYVYRTWFELLPPGPQRGPALAGLARLQERRHDREAARVLRQEMAREFGDRAFPILGPEQPVWTFLTQHLTKPTTPARGMAADPEVTPPLGRAWQISLDMGERLIGAPSGLDCCLFARGRDLVCREVATGKIRWACRLGGTPLWAACYADCVLAASATCIQGLGVAEGRVLWECSLPRQRESAEDGLNHFQLAAGRLFFLQANCRLFALDALSGRVLWDHRAPGAWLGLPYPGGRFNPHYHAGRDWVIVQTMGGRVLVLDSDSGRPRTASERRTPLWPQAPLPVDEQHLGLVAGLRQVELFEPATGRSVWTRTTAGPSVTRTAPQLVGDAAALFLLVDGWQLERLDPASGRTLWAAVAGSEPVVFGRAAWDRQAVYYVTGQTLRARRLTDGRLRWGVRLPSAETAWRVDGTHRPLRVFAAEPTRHVSWSPVFAVPPCTVPFFGTYALAIPFNVQYRELPLVLCDAADGKVLQHLRFQEPGPWGRAQGVKGGAVVAGSRTAWGLKPGGERLSP
jgi:outer membrane protein assembly factor BamB/tetratricopeptide (TPR) repeat protein